MGASGKRNQIISGVQFHWCYSQTHKEFLWCTRGGPWLCKLLRKVHKWVLPCFSRSATGLVLIWAYLEMALLPHLRFKPWSLMHSSRSSKGVCQSEGSLIEGAAAIPFFLGQMWLGKLSHSQDNYLGIFFSVLCRDHLSWWGVKSCSSPFHFLTFPACIPTYKFLVTKWVL